MLTNLCNKKTIFNFFFRSREDFFSVISELGRQKEPFSGGLFLFYLKHLHNIQFLHDQIDSECFGWLWRRHWWTVGYCLRTLIVFVAVCSVCVMMVMCDRGDPDASCRPPCQRDAAARTGSRIRASLSIVLDSESNVLISRNLHSAVNTKILSTHFHRSNWFFFVCDLASFGFCDRHKSWFCLAKWSVN